MARQAATEERQTYLVEHYRPGLDADELRRSASRVGDGRNRHTERSSRMRRSIIVLATVLAVAATTVWIPVATGANDDPWKAVKAATARYNSLEQAEKAGYVRMSPCVSSPAGTMGFHYENAALMADDTIDPLRPEILVYAPKANGRLRLVAIEYWKRDADGSLATSGDRPSLYGVPFNGPMPGHSPVMPVHYDLHVWLFAKNPAGRFAQFNPALSCTP